MTKLHEVDMLAPVSYVLASLLSLFVQSLALFYSIKAFANIFNF